MNEVRWLEGCENRCRPQEHRWLRTGGQGPQMSPGCSLGPERAAGVMGSMVRIEGGRPPALPGALLDELTVQLCFMLISFPPLPSCRRANAQ